MATLPNLFNRILRRGLKPRSKTVQNRYSPLGQIIANFELESRLVPATNVFINGGGTGVIQAAIDTAVDDTHIWLGTGVYLDKIIVPSGLSCLTISANTFNGNTATAAGVIIKPSVNDPLETLGNGSGRIINVLGDDFKLSNVTLDGSGNAASFVNGDTSAVIALTNIWASKGVANSLAPGGGTAIGGITIEKSIFKNFGGDAISLSQNAIGGTINQNTITNYGAEVTTSSGVSSPWAAIYLGDNSIANVTNNIITVPNYVTGCATGGFNYGVQVDYLYDSPNACISNNNITVNRRGIGISLNMLLSGAGDVTVANNTISVANGVPSSPPWNTRGINVFSVFDTGVALNNNTLGGQTANGTGRFDRGIEIWDTGHNVSITGGSINNANIGLKVDGVDPFYGSSIGGTTCVNVSNLTIVTPVNGNASVLVTNLDTTQFPSPPGDANLTFLPSANVKVNIANSQIATLNPTGNNLVASSNSSATYESRITLTGSTVAPAPRVLQGGAGNLSFITDNTNPARLYDFGIAPVSNVQTFYTGVANNTVFSGSYGFPTGNSPIGFSAGGGNNLTRDGIQGTANATFRVNLPAGTYDVVVNVGYLGGVRKTGVTATFANGTAIANGTTFGQINTSYSVANTTTVRLVVPTADNIDFRFSAPSGSTWSVNGMSITPVQS